jgi:hypothetical protein
MFENRQEAAAAVYQSFLNSGFSPAQARALTAEINRENSLRERYLFGTHTDPKNEATNLGMLSWQGSRAPKVRAFLREAGALDEQGRIIPGMKALQAQTDFIKQEMETQPEYRRTREEFLANPNVDPETAAVVLGDNYIRWRRTDPEYSASGNKAIAEGYELLGGAGAEPLSQTTYESRRRQYALGDADPGTTAQVLQAVAAGDMTKAEASKFVSEDLLDSVTGKSAYDILNPDEAEEEASLLDRLGDAAKYMDFAGVGQAQQLPSPGRLSTSINRGVSNVGSSALKRFGLASLV